MTSESVAGADRRVARNCALLCFGRRVERETASGEPKTSIDKQFQEQVRDMVKPGTSALFLMVEKVSRYGGTVLKTSLSKDDEKELQDALHGDQAAVQ